jgi:nondiscriminating glutamyl-tRNA synthetase
MDHPATEKVIPKEGQGMEKPPRVRFAPSPTGLLHVGNARTALFNFLLARQQGGTFILRMEDTDVERSTPEAEKAILEDLRWLGLDWDEGPEKPGEYGPYRQSERLEIYRRLATELLEKGKVYRCYCTPEELEEKRKRLLSRGIPPKYDGRCRNLSPEEEKALAESGRPASLRFKVEARRVEFEDLVKGRVSFDALGIGDFIILRSDGIAPYNFAVVVDDELMGVTHVLRGEDHLTNTPRQILLYQALGFSPPKFGHLSMILGPDRSPLSKRHGATAVSHFREEGYLPEALVNYLALLGWSSEDSQEILGVEELIKKFSLKRVSRSSAIFNFDKLKWVNRAHMKALGAEKIVPWVVPFLKKAGIPVEEKSGDWVRASVEPFLEEADTLAALAEETRIFFDEGFSLESGAQEVLAKKENQKVLQGFLEELPGVEEFTPENFKPFMVSLGKRVERSGRGLYLPLRMALTGKSHGPELDKILAVLGKERSRQRVATALKKME